MHDSILAQDFSSFTVPTPPYSKPKYLDRKQRLELQELKYDGLKNLYKTLYLIFSYLELPPNIRLRTIYLIKKNHQKHNINYTQLACASLIETIKENKLLIPDTEIIATFKEFNMKITRRPTNTSRRELGFKARLTVTDYLKRYLSTLHEQNQELEYRVENCLELAKLKRKYQGNDPKGFAAAIIWLVYRNQKITQKQLFTLSGVCLPTIQSNHKLILNELKKEGIFINLQEGCS